MASRSIPGNKAAVATDLGTDPYDSQKRDSNSSPDSTPRLDPRNERKKKNFFDR